MPDELLEGLLIGATIGLAVIAIRTLLAGTSAGHGLALALAGVALCGVQLLLSLRRARRAHPPADPEPPPTPRRHPSRNNPFAQELTRNWTGLNDQPIEESGAQTEPPHEQPDQRP
ncbi:MAG: hypothetical protein ACJ8CR_13220 [Roseiflexaceae bacterium]